MYGVRRSIKIASESGGSHPGKPRTACFGWAGTDCISGILCKFRLPAHAAVAITTYAGSRKTGLTRPLQRYRQLPCAEATANPHAGR